MATIFGQRLSTDRSLSEGVTPVVQEKFTHGPSVRTYSSTAGTGTITSANNLLALATGTTALSYASLATRAVHARPGQDIVYDFSNRFTTGVASSVQIAGPHTGGDGAGFGYDGTSFGVLTRRGGKRAVAVLTVSAASSASATGTVRLNGTNYTTPTLSNAGGNTAVTANEIAAGSYSGWYAQAVGSTVVFVAVAVGTATAGTYTFTHATAAGSFPSSTVSADGAAVTDSWVAQASWNIDRMNGSGESGTTIDPTKLNFYRIISRPRGIEFWVLDPANDALRLVHRQLWANAQTTSVVINNSYPLRWTVGSVGSTTNITMYTDYGQASVVGPLENTMPSWAASGSNTGVTSSAVPILSISVKRALGTVPTVAGIILQAVGAALVHTKAGYVSLVRGATLTGARWTEIETSSVVLTDTTATAYSGGRTLLVMPLSSAGEILETVADLFLRLEPGETLTLIAAVNSGTGADVRASLSWKELS